MPVTALAATVLAVVVLMAMTGGRLDAQGVSSTRIALVGGRLLEPERGAYRPDVAIVVDSSRVIGIQPRARFRPNGERVIDVSGLTILPGLIDAHVHLSLAGRLRENAAATLRAGFTTVADLGAVVPGVLRLRDSINAGAVEGPAILGAGLWIGKGGGICEFGGIGVKGDTSAYRARVRENVGMGADLIKVCVSKWLSAAYAQPDESELAPDALGVVVDEAHRQGRKVIAHDLSLGGVRMALAAGVDGLAHGALVDSITAREMARRGMFVIPTLSSLTTGSSGAAERALAESVFLAWKLGVPLVFGTDAGVLAHGTNATEFVALAKAGLTPLAIVQAATINAAIALGIADRAGTIAVGRPADIIAVAGDPLQDVAALGDVRLVVRGGRVYRR